MPSSDIRSYLSVRRAASPSISPDGGRIAFLTDISGHLQAWTVPVEGGWPDQVTFGERRAITVKYSPVSLELLVSTDVGGNERHQLSLVRDNGSEPRTLTDAPESIHYAGEWSPDGSKVSFTANRRDPATFDVYVRDIEGEEQVVRETDWYVEVAGWSPDGGTLVLSQSAGNLENELYLLDIERKQLSRLTAGVPDSRYASVTWSDDGWIYLVTDLDSDVLYPARMRPGGTIEPLFSDPGWDVEQIVRVPHGDLVAWSTNEDGASTITLFDIVTKEVLAGPKLPTGVVEGLTVSGNGKLLAFVLTGPRHNPDVWTYDIASGRAHQVTRSSRGGLSQDTFVEPTLIRFRSFDRLEVPAWFYLPNNREGEKVPCVIDVHGGPESQRRSAFDPIVQYFLSHGVAVLSPNVRGSTGYGKAYSHLDDVRLRFDSVRDLEYAARWLGTSGKVDPKRLAVVGGSYGGFMVLAALTSFPDIWAAGVDIVGIANLVTFLENTGPWRRKLREIEYGSLESDRDFLEEISPIHKVDRLTAPLLVIHGANDPRVPISEAEQIVASLRERNRTVDYLRFEDEGHGIAKYGNRIVAYEAIAAFLEKHLGG